jgi:hypothetical protein
MFFFVFGYGSVVFFRFTQLNIFVLGDEIGVFLSFIQQGLCVALHY